jgi:AbrB family looped-hinge helix DNA binding protein
MKVAQTRITGQGQISVPAEVRRRLGLGPGSILEWDVEDEQVVVRRAGRYTFEAIHRALFRQKPKARSLAEIDEGIRRHVRKRHARG